MPKDFSTEKQSCITQAEHSSIEVMKSFHSCTQVANTFRFDEGSKLKYYATLYTANGLTVSSEHEAVDITDKVGSGDCFMAGLIYGNINSQGDKQTLEFATAAAVDKMFVMGDATTSTPDQIKKRIKN